MANTHKYVYLFSEGNGSMRELLGGKGANLAEMTNLGMPVPQGFTVTTEACTQYYNDGRQINADIQARSTSTWARWRPSVARSSPIPRTPCWFPCAPAPALHARHDGHHPQPGPQRHRGGGLAKFTNNPRFAYDSYRRFIQMFSDVVMELSKKRFEEIIETSRPRRASSRTWSWIPRT